MQPQGVALDAGHQQNVFHDLHPEVQQYHPREFLWFRGQGYQHSRGSPDPGADDGHQLGKPGHYPQDKREWHTQQQQADGYDRPDNHSQGKLSPDVGSDGTVCNGQGVLQVGPQTLGKGSGQGCPDGRRVLHKVEDQHRSGDQPQDQRKGAGDNPHRLGEHVPGCVRHCPAGASQGFFDLRPDVRWYLLGVPNQPALYGDSGGVEKLGEFLGEFLTLLHGGGYDQSQQAGKDTQQAYKDNRNCDAATQVWASATPGYGPFEQAGHRQQDVGQHGAQAEGEQHRAQQVQHQQRGDYDRRGSQEQAALALQFRVHAPLSWHLRRRNQHRHQNSALTEPAVWLWSITSIDSPSVRTRQFHGYRRAFGHGVRIRR